MLIQHFLTSLQLPYLCLLLSSSNAVKNTNLSTNSSFYRALKNESICKVNSSPTEMSKKVITIVTGNAGKFNEFTSIYGPSTKYNIQRKDLDVAEYQGNIRDICRRKCEDALRLVNTPVIVEDTSLCFNALGGLPGPYIKWFLKEVGPEGLYKMLAGFDDKSCSAVTTIGYADQLSESFVHSFQGVVEGTVVSPRGSNGFGWDSCFQPNGYTQTYAEMSNEMKNEISHRHKAVKQLREFLESRSIL